LRVNVGTILKFVSLVKSYDYFLSQIQFKILKYFFVHQTSRQKVIG